MHQVIRESPSGHRFPGFQANMVVRTPYLRSVSPPGHGSALPWSERAAGGSTLRLRSKLCLLLKRDLTIVQPVGAFLQLILKA